MMILGFTEPLYLEVIKGLLILIQAGFTLDVIKQKGMKNLIKALWIVLFFYLDVFGMIAYLVVKAWQRYYAKRNMG